MSHLREQLSALIDGELTGAELDRAHAHLAACEQCRAEAAALRVLKRELRHLAGARPSEEFTRRLLTMAGPGGPVPPRRQLAVPRPQPAFRAYPDHRRPPQNHVSERPGSSRPAPRSPGDPWAHRRRSRHLVWGAMSFIVTVGIGAAAFSLSGLDSPSGARITPQMELYSIEHAFIGGSIPQLDPGQSRHKPIGPAPRSTTPLP